MKTRTPLLAVCLASICSAALATEYGNVISSTPVVAQVTIPQQSCQNVTQVSPPETTGGGAVAGALIGGLAGNAIGGGAGRALATGLGVVAGAITGNNIETTNTPPRQSSSVVCQNASRIENRVIGYDVSYDYQGQRYQARVPQDPGEHIAINVSAADAMPAQAQDASLLPSLPVANPVSSTVYVSTPVLAPDFGWYAPYGYYGYASFGRPAISIGAHFGGGFHHGRRF